jgi:hypothetical protein
VRQGAHQNLVIIGSTPISKQHLNFILFACSARTKTAINELCMAGLEAMMRFSALHGSLSKIPFSGKATHMQMHGLTF